MSNSEGKIWTVYFSSNEPPSGIYDMYLQTQHLDELARADTEERSDRSLVCYSADSLTFFLEPSKDRQPGVLEARRFYHSAGTSSTKSGRSRLHSRSKLANLV